jgi:hypothetical protein
MIMRKTDKRRLGQIEGALSPKEAFCLWLASAQAHECYASYVLWLRDQPMEEHPLQTLPQQVEQGVRLAHKGSKPAVIEQAVVSAVRDVVFYHELHSSLTGRLAVEWRQLVVQGLLALSETQLLLHSQEQRQIDRARWAAIHAVADLLSWKLVLRTLADRYLDGRSFVFPAQEADLVESLESATYALRMFNEHMQWLRCLEESAPKKKHRAPRHFEPVDVAALEAGAKARAAMTAEQFVLMAKAEAARCVHQTSLAVEMLDRVVLGPR